MNPVDLVLLLVVVSLSGTLVLMDRFVVPAFAAMYKDFGGALPLVTRLVVGHIAPFGGAAAAIALAVTGIFARKRFSARLALLLGLGGIAVGLVTVAFCFYALYAPMFDLAGKVKP